MTALPASWTEVQISELADIVSGATPSTKEPAFWGDDVRWVTPDDLSRLDATVIDRGRRNLSDAGYAACSAQMMPAGSIVMSSRAPIGHLAIAGAPLCTNQGCKSFVPADGIDSRYLYWYLKHMVPKIQEMGSGTTFAEVSGKVAATIPVVVAPSAEQLRIVEELERRLSHVEAAVGGLTLARTRIRLAREATLSKIVSDSDGRWPSKSLGDLLREPLRNGRSAPTASNGDGIRTFTLTAVTRRDFSEANTKQAVGDAASVEGLWAQPGDIFIQRSNTPELVGSAALYDGPPDFAVFPDLLIRVRPKTELVLPEWVDLVLRAPSTRAYFRSVAQGLAGSMPKISQPKIAALPVPVPELGEQATLVAEADRRLSLIDAAERTIEKGLKQADQLRASLLSAAFSGRLVPQDPSDEPATELLDRIRATRTSAPKRGRRSRTKELTT